MGIILPLVFFVCTMFYLAVAVQAKDFTMISGHPRIFINSTNLATLRNRAETTHAGTYAKLKDWCDANWDNSVAQKKIFKKSSKMVDAGCLRYALVFVLGEIPGYTYSHHLKEYGAKAVDILVDSLSGPSFYGRILMTAVTYDWVYNCLSDKQKRLVIDWFHKVCGNSPTVTPPEKAINGYRITATPRCLYPALAFYGDGYKQKVAELYLNFVKGSWFDDLNAVFHQAGEDGGHSAGPGYAKNFYPAYYCIYRDFYAIYTATTATLMDLFGPYSYVSGFPEWLLHNLQPGPSSPTPWRRSVVAPLHKFGDMYSLWWNLKSNKALGKTFDLLAQVAALMGQKEKASMMTWFVDDLMHVSYSSTFEIIFKDKTITAKSPAILGMSPCKAFGWKDSGVIDSYLNNPKAGLGEVFMRSSWDDLGGASTQVTYAAFKAPPYFYFGHQHYNALAFSIFKGEPLALASSGAYWPHYEGARIDYHGRGKDVVVGSPHHWLYYERLSGNILLIMDPHEIIYTEPRPHDGDFLPKDGGQKKITEASSFRWGEIKEDSAFDTGGLIHYEDAENYTYSSGDATKAYNSKIKGRTYVAGKASPKVSCVQRDFVYLKSDGGLHDYFVVFDRISSTDPTYKKVFLLHTVGEPILNGNLRRIYGEKGSGLYESSNTDSIAITQKTAKMFVKTLLPTKTHVYKMGGVVATRLVEDVDNVSGLQVGGSKIDLKVASTNGLPDCPIVVVDGVHEKWGPFKECFMCEGKDDAAKVLKNCIRGRRYYKKNYPAVHAAGAKVAQYYAWMYREADTDKWLCHPLDYGIQNKSKDFVNDCDEYGRWTLRIESVQDEIKTNFLHVLRPTTDMAETAMAETSLVVAGDMAGVVIVDAVTPWVVIFPKTGKLQDSIDYQAAYGKMGKHLICGLKEGVYAVFRDGKKIETVKTSHQNTLFFEADAGQSFRIIKSK